MFHIVERLRLENDVRLSCGQDFSDLLLDAALRIETLERALKSVLDACDQGRMVSRGIGDMSIEAQVKGSVYTNVPAWPIEEAREVLYEQNTDLD